MFCLILIISFFFFISPIFGQTSCIKTYSNLAINGNDIHGVQGSSSSCCQYCQQIRGCQAYTWNTFNGGTCWLKNDTQPLYNSTGEYTGILSPGANNTYSLLKSYDASNWFNNETFVFNSFHYTDHKNGFVNYVDYETAKSEGLVGVQNGKVYMGMDNTTILPPNSTIGRNAIRINTLIRFNSGLFIFDIDHMPTGPGLWPAFWTEGPKWPSNGEIDMLEGISEQNFNQITLHTGENCAMTANDSRYFTGKWNYGYGNNTNSGCDVLAPNGTFNTGFNQASGGVFVLEWDREKFIRIWNFVRPNIPEDIAKASPNPNPSTWGMPTAYYTLGPNCTPDHFNNNTIIINSDLCGVAGTAFQGGELVCEDVARNHPEEYSDAYWLINSLKVYCKPNTPCPN
uniref:GH16 domain-containing protein n=1 Tax=Acrobeloides nanus TaxID=290746 RepID=A0A914DYY9_9BILA